MKLPLMAFALTLLISMPAVSQEEDAPNTDSLATVLVSSIQDQDAVGFAQCWISASDFLDQIETLADEYPEVADEVPTLEDLLEYHRERNRLVHLLYENLEAAIVEHDLSVEDIVVDFGEVRRVEEGRGLIRYEAPQAFVLKAGVEWSIAFVIDDVYSFGGRFLFFDSPLSAVLTLPNGETVNLLASDDG